MRTLIASGIRGLEKIFYKSVSFVASSVAVTWFQVDEAMMWAKSGNMASVLKACPSKLVDHVTSHVLRSLSPCR